jgi:serine/threonine protein kinase
MVMADDLIGKQLDEYRLDALLGQGGMARVYRALDVRLERWVAIKVIDASFRSDSDYMARFEREARAIAQLEHPHIVSLYRYGEVEGLLYMAMRYVEGMSLDTLLATYHREGKLIPVAEAHRVIHQACQALDYAHSRGVIHRDIKPANIMLDKQGNAFLADFGLALVAEVGTRGEIFGTPHYIAPEQAMSSAGAVAQSDLYAVGVILFEMFTGELPFDAASALDVAMLHMSEPPPPPRQIRPDLQPELEAVILKALEKEPEARYQTGAKLVQALDQALKATSQVSLPLPPPGMSIPQRVVVDLAERPLPPVPAGVPPTPPLNVSPEERQAEAAAPLNSTPVPPLASSKKSRPLVYAGVGVGLLLMVGVGLILAVALALFLLRNNNNPGEVAEATPAAIVEVVATTAPTTEPAAAVEVVATTAPTTEVENTVIAPEPSPTPPPAEATPTPQPTPLPQVPVIGNTENPLNYELLIAKRSDDSLFVVNQTILPLPLPPLQIHANGRVINGADWDIAELQSGDCISAWKEQGKPKAPDVTCNEVERRTIGNKDRFWKESFEVYYGGQWLADCQKDEERCLVQIPVELLASENRIESDQDDNGGDDD